MTEYPNGTSTNDFGRRVFAEQTRQLYSAVPGIVSITIGVAALLVVIHWPLHRPALLLGWLFVFLLVAALRLVSWRSFSAQAPDAVDSDRWYRRLLVLTLASGLVWGVVPWLFLVESSAAHLALMAFVVAGLGAGGMVNLAPRWQCAWVFLLPTLLPFAARFALLDVPMAGGISLFILAFLAALMVLSWRYSSMVSGQIRHTLEHSERSAFFQRERLRYQSLVESTRAIVWEAEPDTLRLTYISPEVGVVLGYSSACGQPEPDAWRRHLHPDDRDRVSEAARRMIERQQDDEFDFRAQASDGRMLWLRCAVKVVKAGGRVEKLVGVTTEITAIRQAQEALEYSAGLQELMVEAAQQFLSQDAEDFDPILDRMLARAGAWCGADRSYLIRFSPDLDRFTNTHEWTAPGVRPEKDGMQDVSTEVLPAMLPQLVAGETVIIEDISELPDAWSVERDLLASQQICSLLVLPVLRQNHLIGLVGFDSVSAGRGWKGREVDLLRVLANLVGSALHHQAIEQQLNASERLRSEAESLAAMGSWAWRVGSDDFEASAEWRRVLGCGDGPLSRQQVLELTPADARSEVIESLERSIDSGQAYDIEHRILRPCDGQERWLKVHAEMFEDSRGQVMRGFAQDITLRKQAELELYELAHYDSLTGLPNRLLMLDRLRRALTRSQRRGGRLAVLFLDLDQFKKINDTLGHDAGDQALIEAAGRLERLLRERDTVARIGGDEFLMLIEDFAGMNDLVQVAGRVREAFHQPVLIAGREFVLTVSIGIALAPHDADSATELMQHADTAMYHAKHSGRDAVQFFTQSMSAAVQRRLDIEEALRGAAERGEIRVQYQPLVRLSDRQVIGAEALLRWHHPSLGPIAPDEFIDVAEQTGLIDGLGRLVLSDVFAHLSEWRMRVPCFTVSVNVSPRQFRDSDFAARLIRDLSDHRLPGEAIELEVTEGVLLTARPGVIDSFERLRDHGVGLVMDDFGTGYSSLSYLRDYPFSAIKIDRSFVGGMDADPKKRQLVNSAIRLAHALDLKVIAEGVETEQELSGLLDERCDLAQGYLFARAMPAEQLVGMLPEPDVRTRPE